MRTIRPPRRGKTLKILPRGSSSRPMFRPRAPNTTCAAAGGHQGCADLAPRVDPPAEGVAHLLAPVPTPPPPHPLPAAAGIEPPRRSFEITAPKGAEKVDHDRLEVLLADAWH